MASTELGSGAIQRDGPEAGLHERAAKEIAAFLRDAGVANEPLGVDMAETSVFLALQKEGLHVVDGQQPMMAAREIKRQSVIKRGKA